MQVASKLSTVRLILSSATAVLILAAIIMEFLPEDEAKVFVIPILVAALFVGASQIPLHYSMRTTLRNGSI